MMEKFIEVLKENPNHAYDFIANEYYKMSKEELRDVVKELLYAIYDNPTVSKMEHDEILKDTAKELEEQYMED